MGITLTDDTRAGILVKGDFTYAEVIALVKDVLSRMGEAKAMLIRESKKEGKFYLAFFVSRLDALLWGQGGGFMATMSKKKQANLVAVGEYGKPADGLPGALTIKVHSGIISKRITFSPKRLEAIERFYEFIKLFQEHVNASGKGAECSIGMAQAAPDISYRRKLAILGGR
jgi:hypothetical protein